MDFVGDDLAIFMFTSSINDQLNRMVNQEFIQLAKEVRNYSKRIKFLAYDLNLLGPAEGFDMTHPDLWLIPGNDRLSRPRKFRGDPRVQEMAEWLVINVSNKFEMNTKDLNMRMEMAKYAEE